MADTTFSSQHTDELLGQGVDCVNVCHSLRTNTSLPFKCVGVTRFTRFAERRLGRRDEEEGAAGENS